MHILTLLQLQVCTKGKLHIFKYLSASAHEQEKVWCKSKHSFVVNNNEKFVVVVVFSKASIPSPARGISG